MKDYIIFRNLRRFSKKDDQSKVYHTISYAQERRTKDNTVFFKEDDMFISADVYEKLLTKNLVYGDICSPILKQGVLGQRPTLIDLDVVLKSSYVIED